MEYVSTPGFDTSPVQNTTIAVPALARPRAWLEFSQPGEQPTHARVAAALGIDPATVRNQRHKVRARAKAACTATSAA